MPNQTTRNLVNAGFSTEEIRAQAITQRDTFIRAGFSTEEANKGVFEEYGINLGYDPDDEDMAVNMQSNMEFSPEQQMEQVSDYDADLLYQNDKAAQEKFERSQAIKRQQGALHRSRNFADLELEDPTLYLNRDSVMVESQYGRVLTESDKMRQDAMIQEGKLVIPVEQDLPKLNYVSPNTPIPRRMTIAENAYEALLAGHQGSVAGLFFAGEMPNIIVPQDAPYIDKFAQSLGGVLGDIPTFVLGAALGGAAASETGPGAVPAAVSGGFALTDGARTALIDSYTRGNVDNFEELMWRISNVGIAAGGGGLTGYMTGGAGQLAGRGVMASGLPQAVKPIAAHTSATLAETATLVTAQSALHGTMPTTDDFIIAAGTLGTMKLSSFYTNKLYYNFAKNGKAPASFIEYTKNDMSVKEDLASGNLMQPRSLGGDYTPIYTLQRNEPIPGVTTSGRQWFYLSENLAGNVASKTNKKNSVVNTDAPEAYNIKPQAISAETNLLWIKSKNDPNKVRLYKQFMLEQNPEATFSNDSLNRAMADNFFAAPPDAFVAFLESGRGRIGVREDIPITNIQGLRMGDKVLVFNKRNILPQETLDTAAKPLEVSVNEIADSISVNESAPFSLRQKVYDSYQAVVDKFQPLNRDAAVGRVTVPYMAARLNMGVDGLINHWLTLGRTSFVSPSTRRPGGQAREVTGSSLESILNKGTQRSIYEVSPEVSSAVESLGGRIRANSLESNNQVRSALKQMRLNGEIEPAQYKRMEAQLLESDMAIERGASDPLFMFRNYLVAKHVAELSNKGVTAGPDLAAARAIANNPGMRSRFEAAAQELYAYQKDLLKYQYEAGLISKKSYDKMVLQYPDYIPMNRVMEDGALGVSTGTFGIKGSERAIVDPFESIIGQTYYAIRAAEKNTVKTLIADAYGKKIPKKNKAAEIGTLADFIRSEAERRGANAMETVRYRVAGKERAVEVPRDIARTADLLDPVSANMFNGLINGAARIAGVLRAGAILHPSFAGRNFFRDQFSAAINSTSGYKIFYDFGRGLASMVSHKTGGKLFPNLEKYYSEWLRNGGSLANLVSQDRKYTQETINRLLHTNNVVNSVPFTTRAIEQVQRFINPVNWAKGGYRALQRVSEASEEGTRMGEYIRAREAGISQMESAYRSREVTMDFARIGAGMKALNAMSVFLNARIQGADRTIRQLKAHPGQTMSRIVAGVVLPSFLLSLVNNDIIYNEPDSDTAKALKEIPEWQKQLFWIIPTPVGIFRVPKPHEFGIPFANPMESFVDYMYQNSEDKNYLEYLYDSEYFGSIADQFFLDPMTIISSLIPSALTPMAEVMFNYDMFMKTPIIPASMEKQLPETRYNRNTTELAKNISRMLSEIDPFLHSNLSQRLISPPSIDHYVAGYGGSIGRDLWNLLDTVAQKAGIIDQVNKPTKSLEDLPLIKSFMIKYPNAGSKSIEQFYERAEVYEQTLASIKALLKEGRGTSIQQAEALIMERDYGRFTKLRAGLAQVSRGIRTIHYSEDFSPEEKRELIDGMYIQMIEMAQTGLSIMNDIEATRRDLAEEQ